MCYVLSSMPGVLQLLQAAASAAGCDVQFIDKASVEVTSSPGGEVSFGGAAVLLCEQKQLVEAAEHARGFDANLKWVMTTSAGVEHAVATLRKKDPRCAVRLTRYGRGFGGLMSEWALLHILAHERKLRFQFDAQRRREWLHLSRLDRNGADADELADYRSVAGLTMTIIGLGSIGKEVGRVCKQAFNMKVIGVNSTGTMPADCADFVDEVAAVSGVRDVFGKSDYIFNLLPSTDETSGLLDRGQFDACDASRRTVFMNAGRGSVVSEDTLVRSLDAGRINHCILDVFAVEPLPESSKLWGRADVTITPHVAAVSEVSSVVSIFIDNAKRFSEGSDLLYEVKRDAGY